jgi:RHS repeat-associated protein
MGTMTSVTNMNAGIIDSNRFAPYGEPIDPVAKNSRRSNSSYGFTGEAHGIEEGLVYLRARYYEPNTMRFLSQDTVLGDIKDPLTRNLYIYGNANPMTYVDPSGHFAFIPYLIKAGAHAAADLMLQTTMNYLFNPTTQFNFKASLGAVNWWQVGRSAVEGLIPSKKGYVLLKAAGTAIGDVIVNAMHNKDKYTTDHAIRDFATGFMGSLAGDGISALVNKYGMAAIKKGLKKIGFSDAEVNTALSKKPDTDKNTHAKVIKKFSQQEIDELAFKSIKGRKGADSVMLGKYIKGSATSYEKVAKAYDSQYFQLDNFDELKHVYKMSDDEIFRINERFLEIQTSSGRDILLSHNPLEYLGGEGFYSRELNFLIKNGYKFKKVGEIWLAYIK